MEIAGFRVEDSGFGLVASENRCVSVHLLAYVQLCKCRTEILLVWGR